MNKSLFSFLSFFVLLGFSRWTEAIALSKAPSRMPNFGSIFIIEKSSSGRIFTLIMAENVELQGSSAKERYKYIKGLANSLCSESSIISKNAVLVHPTQQEWLKRGGRYFIKAEVGIAGRLAKPAHVGKVPGVQLQRTAVVGRMPKKGMSDRGCIGVIHESLSGHKFELNMAENIKLQGSTAEEQYEYIKGLAHSLCSDIPAAYRDGILVHPTLEEWLRMGGRYFITIKSAR